MRLASPAVYMDSQRFLRRLLAPPAALAAAYGGYAGWAWLRYGRPRRPAIDAGEADLLLDRFMPDYEVVERHSVKVDAPAGVTLAAACEVDFDDSKLIRAIFKGRELLLGADPAEAANPLPRGLLAKTQALGWGVLAEIPGREIVMGAVTQPWEAKVVFRTVEPERFTSYPDPACVKIAWTLRADPVAESTSVFRTETRVMACGPDARAKFRRYWAFLSPGIILIRWAMLGLLKREAERRAG